MIRLIRYDNDAGDVFWGNIGAGILPICTKTKRILVNYRSSEVNEPHTWGLWCGKLDEGFENIEDAVKREFLEESGYDEYIELIPAYVFESEGNTFEYHNFIGLIDEEFTPELDWESDGYKWLSFSELMDLKDKHFGLENLLSDSESLYIIKNNCL